METQPLQAEIRIQRGKGQARQLRMRGMLPAVVYGGSAGPTSATVSEKALSRALSTQYGKNAVLKLQLGDNEQLAMVKELQVHPLSRRPLHVDFLRVEPQSVVRITVPFVTKGQAKGVAAGGTLRAVFRDVPVITSPDAIPTEIEAEVGPLQIGDILQVKDLDLPQGVQLGLPSDRTLVAVMAEVKEEEPEEEKPEAEEEAAAEEPQPSSTEEPAS